MLKKKFILTVAAFAVMLTCAGMIFTETKKAPITTGIGHIDLEIF